MIDALSSDFILSLSLNSLLPTSVCCKVIFYGSTWILMCLDLRYVVCCTLVLCVSLMVCLLKPNLLISMPSPSRQVPSTL